MADDDGFQPRNDAPAAHSVTPPIGEETDAISAAVRYRRTFAPLPLPRPTEVVKVENHRQLLSAARTLSARIEDDPQFSVMFLANPVLALEHYGIELSQEMQHHVLHSLRHPPKLRARREELETSLKETLGAPPQPNDPQWMARLVFETRGIEPREIGDGKPEYKSPYRTAIIEKLKASRPKATDRYKGKRRLKRTATVRIKPHEPSVRLLDLDAEAPALPPARNRPPTLSLEDAWFYKDDPVVREALELGQIERRAFPFQSPDSFRRIVAGEKVDAFRSFVSAVRIPVGSR